MAIPDILPIRLMEDLHTALVGRCPDGSQFFLNDFSEGSTDVLVLYRFDADGNYLSHELKRTDGTQTETAKTDLLATLDTPTCCDIAVRPFVVSVDGVKYGLLVEADSECVHLQPHSQITFMAPWDGEYYT